MGKELSAIVRIVGSELICSWNLMDDPNVEYSREVFFLHKISRWQIGVVNFFMGIFLPCMWVIFFCFVGSNGYDPIFGFVH